MNKNLLLSLVVAVAVLACGKKTQQNPGEATLDDLSQALTAMSMRGTRRPLEINDLTNFPSLRGKALPKPPPGKKLVIDRAQQKVRFADQ